jgi:hypothetical protein
MLSDEYRALHAARRALAGFGVDLGPRDQIPMPLHAYLEDDPSMLGYGIAGARDNVFNLRRYVVEAQSAGETEKSNRWLAGAKMDLESNQAALVRMVQRRNQLELDRRRGRIPGTPEHEEKLRRQREAWKDVFKI